jgi:hypothetical protein
LLPTALILSAKTAFVILIGNAVTIADAYPVETTVNPENAKRLLTQKPPCFSSVIIIGLV